MQSALIAAALVLGAGPGVVPAAPSPTDLPAAAPQQFYAAAPRPYAPSITIYYPSPSYDCYSHGHNRLECYPAFCERQYRRPYNYRVKFDYPWHEDVYRNWPDACDYDEGAIVPLAEASKVYTGPRQSTAIAERSPAAHSRPNTAAIRDAPSPR